MTDHPTDPVIDLIAEWREARDDARSFPGTTSGEDTAMEAAYDRAHALAERIAETAPTTTAGVLAQLRWVIEDGEACDDFLDPAHPQAIARAIEGLEALA